MACKNGGTKHNWIVSDKDHDFDVCTECGATRDTKKFDSRRGVLSIELLKESDTEIGDSWLCCKDIERNTEIDLFLDRLTGRQKEVAVMLYEGYKQVEIAKILGIGFKAVNNIVSRIKKIALC